MQASAGATIAKSYLWAFNHLGENGVESHFPKGCDSLPHSSVIAIMRDDNKIIG